MKTKKNYLEQSSIQELAKKVLKQLSVSFNELKKYPYDYRDAGAGVGGFIYYSETVKFAKKNMVLIIDALNELENEIGQPLDKPTNDKTQYYNWLAWFALEHVVSDIINYLES